MNCEVVVKKFYGLLVMLLLVPAAVSAERRAGSPLEISQTFAQTAQSPTILYFPDYVDGGEEWSVQLVVGNLDPTRSVPVEVRVYGHLSQRVSRFFNSVTGFELPAQGSRVPRSAGTGEIRRGWIEVRSELGSVKGLLTYRNATIGFEIGVSPVGRHDHFALFVEETDAIGAGLRPFELAGKPIAGG